MNRFKRWQNTPLAAEIRRCAQFSWAPTAYLAISLVILGATTFLWSLFGAQLHHANADQLVNSFLFESGASWQGAGLPDQHSFLFKWPLFYLVKVFGYSAVSYQAFTVLTVLLTIGLFAWLLSRIEKRPFVLGTIFLALASVLLLVPAQPHDGGLLPVNMAMLTTRNLEYMLYIASLFYLLQATKFRSRQFAVGVGLLALLVASDKLFLSASIGGAMLALVVYSIRQRWAWVSIAARWLLGSIVAAIVAVVVLFAINQSGFTHFASQAVTGPYSIIDNPKSLGLGLIYLVGGFLTNFGANPAYDALTVSQIPHQFAQGLLSFVGFAFITNLAIVLFGVIICVRLMLASAGMIRAQKVYAQPIASQLAIAMLWTTVALGGLFVVTNHYYVVDARYLTLGLFSVFIGTTVWIHSKKSIPIELLVILAVLLLLAIISGMLGTLQLHNAQAQALEPINRRNKLVAETLKSHQVDTLVGDYWRVIPAKAQSDGKQQVLPLADCTTPRTVLSSQAWQPELAHKSFAYLLSYDHGLTDFPQCSLSQVTATYGSPNSSALISGSLTHPKEQLLFYDHGAKRPTPEVAKNIEAPATVVPIPLDDVMHTNCQTPTIMNIVAHEDDDLLFMNPDLQHDIREGRCIRTVYLTAGDAGADSAYWLGRQKGSEAAYETMLGSGKLIWNQRIVHMPGGGFITIDTPAKNHQVSLIFMHLPDGNVRGEGFRSSRHESLAALMSGRIPRIETVDRQSSYSSEELIDVITELLYTYQPSEVRVQSNHSGSQYVDHSDHRFAGQIATQAYQRYEIGQYEGVVRVPLTYYMGYPVHELQPNVVDQDLADKQAAFLAYAAFDGGVCRTHVQCQNNPAYGAYLTRQYTNSY